MASAAWSTQQLADFVSAVSAAESEAAAALAAVERAAEAFDAHAVAIVGGGDVVAAVGYRFGDASVADLEAVRPDVVESSFEVAGVGRCAATAVALEYPSGATLVVARAEADDLSRDEAELLRAMARVASLTMRMQHHVGEERAAREELERLGQEQAALHRVATLVAEVAPPDIIFSTVAEEVGRLIPEASFGLVSRYDADAAGELVGTWSRTGDHPSVGLRFPLGGQNLHTLVFETGRPARIDHLVGDAEATVVARGLGARSSAGAPIFVAGRLWGVILVASPNENEFPEGVEHRLADFTELVATAIAKVQAREDLHLLTEEQAALRRVATLVARGEPSSAVFASVAEEVGRIVPAADVALVGRYDSEGALEFVGGWSADGDPSFVGTRVRLGGTNVSTIVFERNEPSRVDYVADDDTAATALAREWARSSAGAPISVEGRLWGVVVVGSLQPDGLPLGIEHELAGFTDLVATAIANSQARAELRVIADEQAALRRVATLIAEAAPPETVFAAVAEEVAELLPAEIAVIGRYGDGSVTYLGGASRTVPFVIGTTNVLGGRNVATVVYETGQSARVESYTSASGEGVEEARGLSITSSVGVPITVAGRLWGIAVAAATHGNPIPPNTEQRLAGFTELVATAIANSHAREELRALAEWQAALRRVATRVARGEPPEAVFAAVAEEVGQLLRVDATGVVRYDPDGAFTSLGSWNGTGEPTRAGSRGPLGGLNVTTLVQETGRPARVDSYSSDDPSAATAIARGRGMRSAVGTPINVGGRLWGSLQVASSREDALSAATEERLESFADLAATAIANAQAREELRTIADEQAALRRVATLVAREAPADSMFDAVTEEVHRLLDADETGLSRYDPDGLWTVLAVRGAMTDAIPIGFRLDPGASMPGVAELLSGRSVRVDASPHGSAVDDLIRAEQLQAWVASPIVLMGRTWGQIAVFSRHGPLPAGTEERLAAFTELVATAVANAETRAELTASRARIVATADETRHRIERDLHDGAQQRLVTTALKLRAAEASVPPELGELAAELSSVATDMKSVLDELREFARGIHPAILSEAGLVAALGTLARSCAVPVELSTRVDERPSETVEVAAYYVVSEALANATKHAEASVVWVDVTAADDVLRIDVRDDGVGGVDPARGSGLVGLRDRVEALGGRISIESPRGKGTSIQVELPLGGRDAANRSHVEGGSP